jgi:hypothetical protein
MTRFGVLAFVAALAFALDLVYGQTVTPTSLQLGSTSSAYTTQCGQYAYYSVVMQDPCKDLVINATPSSGEPKIFVSKYVKHRVLSFLTVTLYSPLTLTLHPNVTAGRSRTRRRAASRGRRGPSAYTPLLFRTGSPIAPPGNTTLASTPTAPHSHQPPPTRSRPLRRPPTTARTFTSTLASPSP